MTTFAGVVTSVNDGARGDFGKSITAKMAVTAEALRDERVAKDEDKNQANGKDCGHAKEMGNVLQLAHKCACQPRNVSNARSYNAGEHRTTGHGSRICVMKVTRK